MKSELDRHEKFDDGSELEIIHTEMWTWRDGDGDVHDDYWPTEEEARKNADHIIGEIEKWEGGIDTGYTTDDYPLPITVVVRTITLARSSSAWKSA